MKNAQSRNLIAAAAAVLMLLGLPLAGAALAGKPLSGYLGFPPMTEPTQQQPFSLPVFIAMAILIVAVVLPFVIRVLSSRNTLPSRPATQARAFPWWGTAGAGLCAAAWILSWTRFEGFAALRIWVFFPLWLGYILAVNGLTVRRGGSCMLSAQPRHWLMLFVVSSGFWWFFEYLNRFVRNWHYLGGHEVTAMQYVVVASLHFSTVLPAVLGTYELLETFPRLGAGLDRFVRFRAPQRRLAAWSVLVVAGIGLVGLAFRPALLFPLVWLAPLFLITSLQTVRNRKTLFSVLRFGYWRRVCLLALAALVCGFFWEMWNFLSLPKWLYTVPYVDRFRIFEMPLLGFAGYLPFGLQCAVAAAVFGIAPWSDPAANGTTETRGANSEGPAHRPAEDGGPERALHIKLISPRGTVRPMDSAWKTRMSPPLALLVLGALTPRRHKVTIADENVERISLRDRPDLVGITVKVDNFQRACQIACHYRRLGVPVVMGGIHATACPWDCGRHADAVVVGEAEEIWPRLLEDVARDRLQSLYRNEKPVDIARVPVPRWELLHGWRYLFTNTMRIGRGCPWRCDFCYNSSENIDARYRAKPMRRILDEIRSLGVPHVMFIDDNFIGDPAFARRMVNELRRMNVTWHAAVSADIGKREELLDAMAESGCKSLFIGFETVNQQSLLNCRKAQNRIESYDATVSAIHERGMMVNASLVFGFDQDDAGVFASCLEWLMRNRVETMTAHILTPYPGTRLHRRLAAQDRIIDWDLRHYNTAHAVFRPALMSARELEHGYRWMYDRFYSWPGIVRRWPVAREQVKAYLAFALVYRKFGKATCLAGRLFGMRNMARLARAMAYPSRRDPPWFETRSLDVLHAGMLKLTRWPSVTQSPASSNPS